MLLWLLPGPAGAVETLNLRLGSLEGEGWLAAGVRLTLTLPEAGGSGLRLRAERLDLPGLTEPIRDLDLDCPQGEFAGARLSCPEGSLRLEHPLLVQTAARVSLEFDRAAGRLDLRLLGLALAGGSGRIDLQWEEGRWQAQLDAKGLDAARLNKTLEAFGLGAAGWELGGSLAPQLELVGGPDGPQRLDWELGLDGLEFGGPAGELFGAGLAGTSRAQLRLQSGRWQGPLGLVLNAGELLTPSFYLGVGAQPVTLGAALDYRAASGDLALKELAYRHPGVLELNAEAELALQQAEPLRRLSLRSAPASLQALYENYLQPLWAEGLLADLDSAGELELSLEHRVGDAARLELALRDVHLEAAAPADGQQRPFGLQGLNGRLVWNRDSGSAETSSLSWAGGHLLETLDIGPASLSLRAAGERFELVAPGEIPLLDGSLLLDRFALSPGADAGGRLDFDAVLTPISMQRLTQALGWPEMSGKLSGVIPALSYEQGRLEMRGNLLVRVFDGEVLVRNLRMEDLLGVWPVLMAELRLRNLDLESLTGTFAFGKITGRLEGEVQGLRLEDWAPVGFDARFNTPEEDDSRRRISQRAVENISDLGGAGISGALSRSFLRGFKEFGYKRLGISCRLQQGICEMGGVAPADDGYYLVEGAGIPRIDIVGFNRRTDWQRLLSQLQQMVAGGVSPVVQ